jgi:hypothetical protein
VANKTLLNAVNDMFQLANIIAGDADALSGLTDSARQHDIDACILALNQTIDELYSSSEVPLPQQQAESTVVLVTGTRAYSLVANFNRLHWPLIDKTNTNYIYEYAGSYDDLLSLDPEQDDTGLPLYGVIRPTDSKLFLNVAPTSAENGNTYTYQYDKDLELSLAADNVPFNNAVYRAVIPAAFQVWKRERRGEFDNGLFKAHLGRSARLLTQVPQRTSYSPR